MVFIHFFYFGCILGSNSGGKLEEKTSAAVIIPINITLKSDDGQTPDETVKRES